MDNIKKILQLLKSEQKKIIFAFVPLTLLLVIFETLSISLFIPIISNVLGDYQQPEIIKVKKILTLLFGNLDITKLIILLSLIYFFKNLYFIFYNFYLFKISNKIQLNLSLKLMNKYFQIPYIDFVKKNSAELLRNIQSETAKIRNGIRYIIILFSEFFVFMAILILIFAFDPKSATTVLFYITLVIIVYFLIFKKIIINLGYVNVESNRRVIKNILENISASKLIRLFYKQKFFIDKLELNLKNYLKNNLHVSIFSLVPRVWVEVFAILGICFALLSLDKANYDKDFIITYLGFISFALIRIIPSVMRISNSYQALKYTSASIDKIEKDLALKSPLKSEIQNNLFKNKIILKDVSLRFEKSKEILLKDVNMEINKNEIILIKGKSGSGKTSLINIISGIYKPSSGIYELDGNIIKDNEISPIKNLGYVTQDTFLFDDKIKNNIAIGKNDIDIDVDRVKNLIKKVELDKFVYNLSDGIDSKIGERGAKISGGQAQRLSIARALYANPDILILDEATNALDKINEEKIFQIIRKFKGNLTVIVISHNPIFNINFDKIYELKDGNLELSK